MFFYICTYLNTYLKTFLFGYKNKDQIMETWRMKKGDKEISDKKKP